VLFREQAQVVSVRLGRMLPKGDKVWGESQTSAARKGRKADRHLFCIEDPFEVSAWGQAQEARGQAQEAHGIRPPTPPTHGHSTHSPSHAHSDTHTRTPLSHPSRPFPPPPR
jgi:hypothetical protein